MFLSSRKTVGNGISPPPDDAPSGDWRCSGIRCGSVYSKRFGRKAPSFRFCLFPCAHAAGVVSPGSVFQRFLRIRVTIGDNSLTILSSFFLRVCAVYMPCMCVREVGLTPQEKLPDSIITHFDTDCKRMFEIFEIFSKIRSIGRLSGQCS